MMTARSRDDAKRKRRARPGVRRRRTQAIVATVEAGNLADGRIDDRGETEIWLQIQARLEIDYLRRRAEQQLELAQAASHTAAVAAHVTIAEAYLERVVALEELWQSADCPGASAAPATPQAPSIPDTPLIQGDDR